VFSCLELVHSSQASGTVCNEWRKPAEPNEHGDDRIKGCGMLVKISCIMVTMA